MISEESEAAIDKGVQRSKKKGRVVVRGLIILAGLGKGWSDGTNERREIEPAREQRKKERRNEAGSNRKVEEIKSVTKPRGVFFFFFYCSIFQSYIFSHLSRLPL